MSIVELRLQRINLPNALSLLRLAGSPWLLLLVALDDRRWVIGLFVLLGLTDWLDGLIARRLKQTTEFGAKLDGVADLVFYPCAALVFAQLFPDYLLPNLPYIGTALVMLAASLLISRWRCGRLILLHTALSRLAGVLVFIALLASFFFDTTLAIRGVAMLYTIAFIEATLIFLRYGAVSADTRSLFAIRDVQARVSRGGSRG